MYAVEFVTWACGELNNSSKKSFEDLSKRGIDGRTVRPMISWD